MKFADAMEKGSTMVEPIAGELHAGGGDRAACALGMAEVAIGRDKVYGCWTSFLREWPWMDGIQVDFPCECKGVTMVGGCSMGNIYDGKNRSFVEAIVHLFNYHVMTKKDWPMKKLIDWVRCVEDHKDQPELLTTK